MNPHPRKARRSGSGIGRCLHHTGDAADGDAHAGRGHEAASRRRGERRPTRGSAAHPPPPPYQQALRTERSAALSGRQETRTLSARGPLGPWPFSKVTAWPSRSWSKRVPWHAELWKKYSLPSSARMNPKPLSLTSRLIVPFDAAMTVLRKKRPHSIADPAKKGSLIRHAPQNCGRSGIRGLGPGGPPAARPRPPEPPPRCRTRA